MFIAILCILLSFAQIGMIKIPPIKSKHFISGIASYYGLKFENHRTATGVTLHNNQHLCAMPVRYGLMHHIVRIKNVRNGKMSWCRIEDNGPFVRGRVLDVTKIVQKDLGMSGLACVRVYY